MHKLDYNYSSPDLYEVHTVILYKVEVLGLELYCRLIWILNATTETYHNLLHRTGQEMKKGALESLLAFVLLSDIVLDVHSISYPEKYSSPFG